MEGENSINRQCVLIILYYFLEIYFIVTINFKPFKLLLPRVFVLPLWEFIKPHKMDLVFFEYQKDTKLFDVKENGLGILY